MSIFVFGILLAATGGLCAQALSWQDVVIQAKAQNPTLKKVKESVDQTRQYYYRSYSAFLPQLSASASAGQSESDTQGFSRDYSLGLSGSLSLFSGFSNVSDVRSRQYDVLIAQSNFTRTVSDVAYTLKRAFVTLLWAQETLDLSQQILKRRNENYDMIRLKYEAGTENRGSLRRIEADRIQAEYDVARAKRGLADASLQLIKAIGRDDYETVTASGSLTSIEPFPAPKAPDALPRIPEYVNAQYALARSALAVTAAKSSLYPGVSLTASRSRTGQDWLPDGNRWGAGLSISYPFFTGGSTYFNIKIAQIGKAMAEQSFAETRQQLAAKLDASITNYLDAVGNIGVRERYLAASREQTAISTAKYINGLTSYQDWYTIENDFINSQRALLNARRDALLSEAQLKNVLGE